MSVDRAPILFLRATGWTAYTRCLMTSDLPACDAVVALADGTYQASLNAYGADAARVCTVQVDTWVYVVGAADFAVSRYDLDAWLSRGESLTVPAATLEADTAEQAWELLRYVREDALVWQCGGCDGWIFTTGRPRIGVLGCSTCGDGGVDFRHADRHVGPA